MDLQIIRELGQKTNRIIEIDRLLKAVQQLADKLLTEDGQVLSVNLDIERPLSDKKKDSMSSYIKNMVQESLPRHVQVIAAIHCSDTRTEFTIGKSHQMIILDAFTRALKQEQEDLSNEIKVETGTI